MSRVSLLDLAPPLPWQPGIVMYNGKPMMDVGGGHGGGPYEVTDVAHAHLRRKAPRAETQTGALFGAHQGKRH
jgi:hypothetical protein